MWRRYRYRGIAVFRYSRWRLLGILDFKNLRDFNSGSVKRVERRLCIKFRGDVVPLRRYRVVSISRWRPSAILDFKNLAILLADGLQRVKMYHHAKFCRNRSIRCRDIAFLVFQDGGRPPSWICCARVWTTHEEHLVVFITVQNWREPCIRWTGSRISDGVQIPHGKG